MRWGLALLLALHAALHALGVLKAFDLAALPQLTAPISRTLGWVWGLAGALLLAAAITLVAAPQAFWWLGALGIALSQVAIVSSWADARAGTLANVALLLGVVVGAAAWGPFGLRADYAHHVERRLAVARTAGAPVTEADLTRCRPRCSATCASWAWSDSLGPWVFGPTCAGGSAEAPTRRGCPSSPSSTASSTRPSAASGWRRPAAACR